MKIPCSVIRDLLPLYAEKMVEPETENLVAEHLAKNRRLKLRNPF